MNAIQTRTRNEITLQMKATAPQGKQESSNESPQSVKLRDAVKMLRESLTRCDEIIQYQEEIRRICREFQATKQCQKNSLEEVRHAGTKETRKCGMRRVDSSTTRVKKEVQHT